MNYLHVNIYKIQHYAETSLCPSHKHRNYPPCYFNQAFLLGRSHDKGHQIIVQLGSHFSPSFDLLLKFLIALITIVSEGSSVWFLLGTLLPAALMVSSSWLLSVS